jgi:hypothetical protein
MLTKDAFGVVNAALALGTRGE